MPNRSSKKRQKAANEIGKSIIDPATGEILMTDDGKNAAAVALGGLGGLKGGRARADSLTVEERSRIAALAAKARWDRATNERLDSVTTKKGRKHS